MVKRMLIDATHPEETRVAIVEDTKLLEYEGESLSKRTLKGNVYLAKIVRVEPSLQAAFVEYGGNRHGFLPFSEIHPDYFRIPISDREKILQEEREKAESESDDTFEESGDAAREEDELDNIDEKSQMKPRALHKAYKIQEVINKGQVVLVQVVKEERGGKGAALTTFLSLPGRYCVLMPNAIRAAGISRKITNISDRRRLKGLIEEFDLPETMGAIIRTAGVERKKQEIKRDLTYLLKLWSSIREKTLTSVAPQLIYEEGNLIQRALRDIYTHEMEEVLIEGKEAYKDAKNLMKQLIPSHSKRVQQVKKGEQSPFQQFNIHAQIDTMIDSIVPLPSGGYLIMNITEALVAIDVNSGKSTRERNIEETAYRTNMEAAEEVARQLRLRDMAGIVVVDFIDMSENKNITAVESKFREFIKKDRARIQVGHISMFGLLELSRQRLRPSLVETASHKCSFCEGTGMVRSIESSALQALRAIDSQGATVEPSNGETQAKVVLYLPQSVAYYILNQKRREVAYLEEKHNLIIEIQEDKDLLSYHYRLLTNQESVAKEHQETKALKTKMDSIEKAMNLMRPVKTTKRNSGRIAGKYKRGSRGDKNTEGKGKQQAEKEGLKPSGKSSRNKRTRDNKNFKKRPLDQKTSSEPQEIAKKDPFIVHDVEGNGTSVSLEKNQMSETAPTEKKEGRNKQKGRYLNRRKKGQNHQPNDKEKPSEKEVENQSKPSEKNDKIKEVEEKKKGWLQRLLEV